MPVLDDLQFDTTGWESRPDPAENRHAWENARGDILTLRFNPGTPKFPSLYRAQALRDYYNRQVVSQGGCILSLDLLHVKGVPIGKLIFKSPQSTGGWGFMGSLNLAYQDFSYSIRMQSVEIQGDEARGQYVWDWLHGSYPEGADCTGLWFGVNYTPESHEVLPCMADDVRWDTDFPDHPLSRLRNELARIVPTMSVNRDVKNSQPHRG